MLNSEKDTDLVKIIQALESVGCQVREISQYKDVGGLETGELSVVVLPVYKKKD